MRSRSSWASVSFRRSSARRCGRSWTPTERRPRPARKKDNARAAQLARLLWKAAAGEGACAYLGRKQIKPHGVRFTGDGLTITCGEQDHRSIDGGQIVVPMCDVSGQVRRAARARREEKRPRQGFLARRPGEEGHFFLIGAITWCCVVAEGYATAASIHEATGLPVAVAFDAGNLAPVAEALKKRYPRAAFIIAADDDYLTEGNPGKTSASAAALKVGGTWLAPTFNEDRAGQKITDFNDLAVIEGQQLVRAQFEAHLAAHGITAPASGRQRRPATIQGRGDDLAPLRYVEELQQRFSLVYEMAETVFDGQEHKLVPLASMRNLCVSRQLHRQWMESREKAIVRQAEVGFDPAGKDDRIKCNLWGGWPTQPRAGRCERLLELLEYLCSNEDDNAAALYQWVLRWLAYPIQTPAPR